MAWRVTPTTDLGKPLDLLLHLPSEEKEEEEGLSAGVGRGGADREETRERRGEKEDRLLPKSVTAFSSQMRLSLGFGITNIY